MITLADYLMGRDRLNASEYSESIGIAGQELMDRVNLLLAEIGFSTRVTSGWRPPSVNAVTPNAAKKSLHMTGHAVDLADPVKTIKRAIIRDPQILVRADLYMEAPERTPRHVHLQSVAPASKLRIFQP